MRLAQASGDVGLLAGGRRGPVGATAAGLRSPSAGAQRAGIFACADVRSSTVKRVVAGAGEGSMAFTFVHQFLAHAERARRTHPQAIRAAAPQSAPRPHSRHTNPASCRRAARPCASHAPHARRRPAERRQPAPPKS